jgi:hypothetical protein
VSRDDWAEGETAENMPHEHILASTTRSAFVDGSVRCLLCGCTQEELKRVRICNHWFDTMTEVCMHCGMTAEAVARSRMSPDQIRRAKESGGWRGPGWDFGKESGKVPGMETSSPTVTELSPEKRAQKVAQITGLFAKTVARGATQQEQDAAHAKAETMLAKYGIDRSECVEQTKAPQADMWEWLKKYSAANDRANEEAEKLRKAQRKAAQDEADRQYRVDQARRASAKAQGGNEWYCKHLINRNYYCSSCVTEAEQADWATPKQPGSFTGTTGDTQQGTFTDQGTKEGTHTYSFNFTAGHGTACQHGNMGPCQECLYNQGQPHTQHVHFTQGTKNRSHKNCTHESTKAARARCRQFNEGYVP